MASKPRDQLKAKLTDIARAIGAEEWAAARLAIRSLLRSLPGARPPPLTADRLVWLRDHLRDLAADVEAVGARDVQGMSRLRGLQLTARGEYDAELARREGLVVVSDAEAEAGLVAGLVAMAPERRRRILDAVAARTEPG